MSTRLVFPRWLILASLFLCAACSPHHAKYLRQWGDTLHPVKLVEGRYKNINTLPEGYLDEESVPDTEWLWTLLTKEYSGSNDVILLNVVEDRLHLAREVDGLVVDTRSYPVQDRDTILELKTRTAFSTTKSVVFWFFVKDGFAVGVTGEGNLSVYRSTSGVMFFIVMPVGAGGGGPGLVYEFARLAD